MPVPLRWLDWIVVLCIAGAIVFGLVTLKEDPGPRRARVKFLSTVLFGLAFLLSGIDSMATTALAARESFVGDITWLRNYGGKNPRCEMSLNGADGSRVQLTGEFSCVGLAVGENVRTTWRAFDASILHIDVLSGPKAGSHLNGLGPFYAVINIGFGAFLVFVGVRVRRLNPDAHPIERKREDLSSSSVDEASIPRLN